MVALQGCSRVIVALEGTVCNEEVNVLFQLMARRIMTWNPKENISKEKILIEMELLCGPMEEVINVHVQKWKENKRFIASSNEKTANSTTCISHCEMVM